MISDWFFQTNIEPSAKQKDLWVNSSGSPLIFPLPTPLPSAAYPIFGSQDVSPFLPPQKNFEVLLQKKNKGEKKKHQHSVTSTLIIFRLK